MLSVDEQIVPTKTTKTSLRQYNPKKPKKWEYKISMLCSSESGIVHQIEFYLVKSEETQSMIGLNNSASVILKLCALLPVHKIYKMFFGNWFSSVPLLVELKLMGILFLCTYQPHCIPSLNFPSDFHIKKTYGPGHMIEKSASVKESGLAAVKWLDQKGVHLLSNFAGSQPQSTASQYNKKTKTYGTIVCPKIVKADNRFMGGIDSFDLYIALSRTKTKSNSKFYRRIFFQLMDMSVVNSWLPYRRDSRDLGVPSKEFSDFWDFKTEIAEKFCCGVGIKRKRFSEVSHGHLTKCKRGRVQL